MNMKKKLLASAMIALLAGPVFADTATDNQTVNASVARVQLIDVADAAVSIALTDPAEAGLNFTSTTDSSSSYAITANQTDDATPVNNKITASITAAQATALSGNNIKLLAAVTAPTGGTQANATTTLSATAIDVVTGIENVAETGLAIDYTLDLVSTAVVPNEQTQAVTVTYTVIDDA